MWESMIYSVDETTDCDEYVNYVNLSVQQNLTISKVPTTW